MSERADDIIVRLYMSLPAQKRRPSAFWRISVDVLPHLRTTKKPVMQSWAAVANFLRGPHGYGVSLTAHGTDADTMTVPDAAKVAQIAMAIVRFQSGRPTSGRADTKNPMKTLYFCAYCWRLGCPPPSDTGFRPAKRLKDEIASSVRCAIHRTFKAQEHMDRRLVPTQGQPAKSSDRKKQHLKTNPQFRPTLVRQGRSKEIAFDAREREVLKADRAEHRCDPQNRYYVKLASIVEAEDRSSWAGFVQRTFPFAAYDQKFVGLCVSPEHALAVLDDETNTFPERERLHATLLTNRKMLGLCLCTMILRADIWVESEVEARLKKAHKARIKRLSKFDPKINKPVFKMPTSLEWFNLNQSKST